MSAKAAPSEFRPCRREPNVRHPVDSGLCSCLLDESAKLRAQLAACAIHAAGYDCLACAAICERLRSLDAPALDLDSLPQTVPPEHQALSFGRLGTPHQFPAVRR